MVITPLGQASTLPPLSPVSKIARVVRRPKSAKGQRNPGAEAGEGDDETPMAAMRSPAEASSSAIQAALSKLELGG
jgi:hypothetical protein